MGGIDRAIVGRAVAPLCEADAAYGVVARFRSVVAAMPAEVALSDLDREVTFAEVAAEAAAVRAAVVGQRLPAGVPVAVLHAHSVGAVSTILGVMASGHPLLVLDPRTPATRLAQFISRAGAMLCLCDPLLGDIAAEFADRVRVLATNGIRRVPVQSLWDDPVDPASPAVLAFTSGSTGIPKIVINDQRMLVVDAWDSAIAAGCYGANDVIALTLPMAFHAGLTQAVHGLVVGATMRIYDVRGQGIGAFAGWIQDNLVTVVHASPAILRAFVGSGPRPSQLASLRSVTIAGEAAYGKEIEALWVPACRRPASSTTGTVPPRPGLSATIT